MLFKQIKQNFPRDHIIKMRLYCELIAKKKRLQKIIL